MRGAPSSADISTCSLWSSCFLAVRSWSLVLLSCTDSSVAFRHSWRGSALASKSFIWDKTFWNTQDERKLRCFLEKVLIHFFYNGSEQWEGMFTCRLVSLLCRLVIIFFQSSLAVFILARTASTLSLGAVLQTSSPFITTAQSCDWPWSLSLRNSWGEKKRWDDMSSK